jgi:shikimate kinase
LRTQTQRKRARLTISEVGSPKTWPPTTTLLLAMTSMKTLGGCQMPLSSSWKERWDSSLVIYSQRSLSNLAHSLLIHYLKKKKRRSANNSQRRREIRKLMRKRKPRRKSMLKCRKRGREER